MTSLFALLALMSTPASAVDVSIFGELGAIFPTESTPYLYRPADTPAPGIRTHVGLTDHISVVGAFNYHSMGGRLDSADESDALYIGKTRFRGETGGLYGHQITKWFRPGIGLSAVFNRNLIRLDDDKYDRFNPGYVEETSLSAGLLPYASAQFMLGHLTANLNLGYSFETRQNYETLGSTRGGNLSYQTAIGVRF